MLHFNKIKAAPLRYALDCDLRRIVGGSRPNKEISAGNEANDQHNRRGNSVDRIFAGISTNIQNRIVSISPSFERFTGYTLADCAGKLPSFLQGRETTQFAISQFQALVLTRKQGKVTIVNYKKNGEPFINDVTIFPMHDLSGTFIGFTSFHELR